MASYDKTGYDVEYSAPVSMDEKHRSAIAPDESGAVSGESFAAGNSLYARIQRLAGRYGVEQRGIERVPEDERTDKTTIKLATMWLAANMTVSTFALGVLAVPVFGLGFIDAVLTIFFFNVLAIIPPAFFATFGPVFGMRTMILGRYWFGFYGVKFIAILSCLACIGWSSVNVIVSAQLLRAVNSNVPGYAGIIIIASGTFIITLFGYKVVHWYEMISWGPCFVILLVVLGEFAHRGDFENLPMGKGPGEAGSVLSFAASIFGFSTGWASVSVDYSVYQPRHVSRVKVFTYTFLGLFFPLCFCMMLGAAVGTATVNNQAYADAYAQNHIGGLLHEILVPRLGNFGRFCVVMLALSIVGNNCPNIYSISFTLQTITHYAQLVPRFIWSFIATVVYCAIAIPGYSHFEAVLENFMLCIGYWLAIYEGISLPEHFLFRRGIGGYQPEFYDQPNKLPPSFAAMTALGVGAIGVAMGMAQIWFVGPIGRLIGNPIYGGDIGFELAFAFTAITYVPLRYLEKKKFGK